LYGALDFLGQITRPFLDGVKGDHAQWMRIFTAEDFARDGRLISLRLVSFYIGAAEWTKIVPSGPKSFSTM